MPALRTLWRTGMMGRCPECGRTPMFASLYALHERCAICDTRYETAPGAWLGAIAIGYGLGALVAIMLAFVEVRWAPLRAAGLDPMWTIAVVSLLATALGYRPAKAVWFALLYEGGFMARGDAPPGPRPPRQPRQ